MSASSWNFKDNLTVDNNKFINFLDSTGITKNNVMGLNTASNLYINSALSGDIYFNSGSNTKSNTFFHANSIGNTFITTRLAVGISDTSNINSNIALPINSYIGINTTQGSHVGYLGLAASSSLLNTSGSRIIMYGIDNTYGSGQIHMYAGNNTSGHIQFYTQNDSMKMQIINSGTTNFQPNGSTIRLSVADINTIITNPLLITSTVPSTSSNNGALVVSGGIGVAGDSYINGTLTINSLIGNINFNSSVPSTGYSSGATYYNGGVGIVCTAEATSETSGGALSVAGGFALGKNAILGGNITVYSTNNSISAVTGSGIFNGGIGVNGQVNIRSNSNSQIKITPVTNNNETSIYFGNQNNYSTSGSWTIGQNSFDVGGSNFAIGSAQEGSYIRLINDVIYIDKYTSLLNTLDIYNNGINDFITFRNTSNNISWSFGRLLPSNDLHISRFSDGSLLGSLITADIKTGNVNILGTENSRSTNSGGALTVSGGAGIGADLYVGEVGYIPRVISTNNTTINLVTTNTSSANLYVSNGLRAEFKSNTLGNLYTNDGNVGINIVNPAYLLDVNGGDFPLRLVGATVESSVIRFENTAAGGRTYHVGSTATYSAAGVGFSIYDLSGTTSRVLIASNGNVGINTISPGQTFDVNGTGLIRSVADSSNSTTAAFMVTGGVSISNTTNATSVTSGGALTIAGGVGILKDVYVGGTVTSSSDNRLKKNLRPLESILDKIENITPLKYNSIHTLDHDDHIGFIAQDFEEHFPELLMRNSQDAYYSLAYDRITALNMACIKELKQENKLLKKRIDDLDELLNFKL
jgi:hypothetical protein